MRRLVLIVSIVMSMAVPARLVSASEPTMHDPGPPYQFKIVDLVFRVEDMGGRVEDMGGRVDDLVVRETETETRVDLAADVLFDFDKATLLPGAEATLTKAAAFIAERNKGGTVRIEGYTDAKGSDSYNKKLSQRRADSVRQWFATHALGGVKFSTEGFGALRPVAPNTKPDGSDDPEGRQKNRRVEIVIARK